MLGSEAGASSAPRAVDAYWEATTAASANETLYIYINTYI